MKIFQNKIPKTWKSSGISFVNNQMEMSNFSFAEDYIKVKENKFIINIIGKSIVGNGLVVISIYKNNILFLKEKLFFKDLSFSKKIINIEEEKDQELKIVISRGKDSKGKILIDSFNIVWVAPESEKKSTKDAILRQNQNLLIPTICSNSEPISSAESILNLSKELVKNNANIIKKKYIGIKKNILKKRIKKINNINNDVKENNKELIDKEYFLESIVEEKIEEVSTKKDIWAHVLDLSSLNDERDIFTCINQISFGRGRQIFLVKNNPEIDLSKYEHVILCDTDDSIIFELSKLNLSKLTFSESNLNSNLLILIKKIRDEL